MSKKGKSDAPSKVILGRVSNHLRMGIVGLPNVGKSTLFNTLTKCQVPAQNYPFCTVEPNTAYVSIPDDRFDYLVAQHKPARAVEASLQITDIAGLVRGASNGEGLGNKFLSHINAVDGIYQVVRVFEDTEITHYESSVDPVRDLETILEELCLKDEEILTNRIETISGVLRHRKDKALEDERACLEKCREMVQQRKPIRFNNWTDEEAQFINNVLPLTAKPMIYLINMSEHDFLRKHNKFLPRVVKWIDERCAPFPRDPIIPYCGVMVAAEVDSAVMAAKESGSEDPSILAAGALAKIIKTGYAALDLIHFFTAGSDEVKCWTVRRGTKAPQAGAVIHTDFERGFVCAEVMAFEDFKEYGSEQEAKLHGKYRQEGRNYEVKDGDIIFFRCNTSGLKKKK